MNEPPAPNEVFGEDEHGLPVATPITDSGVTLRTLIRWATALVVILVVSGALITWWPHQPASQQHGSLAYLETPHAIAAVQTATGALQWARSLQSESLYVAGNTVISSNEALRLVAFAASGRVAWSSNPAEHHTLNFVGGGVLYSGPDTEDILQTRNATLIARDATTGQPRWQADTPPGDTVVGMADAERAYVGLINGQALASPSLTITAYDAQTGNVLWQTPLPNTHYVIPQLVNGHLYVITQQAFYALDAATGQIRWRVQAPILLAQEAPDGTVYLVVADMLQAYAAAQGTLLWQVSLGANPVLGFAAYPGGVIVQTDQAFTVFASTGQIRWRVQGQPQFQGQFLRTATTLYFQDAAGITAYRLDDGAWLWHFATALVPGLDLVLVGATLYASRDNTLYALVASTGQPLWHYQAPGTILMVLVTANVAF